MKNSGVIFCASVAILWFCGVQGVAWAAFSIEADPILSRNTIDFGELHAGEERLREVKLKITNDTGVRYRVVQKLNALPTNAFGARLDSSLVTLHVKDGSLGTVEAKTPLQMPQGDLLLYTSNGSGSQDEMTVVYRLSLSHDQEGGTFTTTITYTLEPLSAASNASVQSTTLHWTTTVRAFFEVHLESATGARELSFQVKDLAPTSLEQVLKVEIHGQLGSQYRLLHQLREPLKNESGVNLALDALTAQIQAGAEVFTGPTPHTVSTQPSEILTSDSRGKGANAILQYQLSVPQNQTAGTYRTDLVYTIQTSGLLPIGVPTTYLFPLTLTIEPRFDLVIRYPEGGTGIAFGSIKPSLGPEPLVKSQEVFFQVLNNTGKPYQILQFFQSPLVQEEGISIQPEDFNMLAKGISLGSSDYLAKAQAVPIGTSAVIYTSDSQGSPETFNVAYQLFVRSGTRQGDYRTSVIFTLASL